MNKIASKEGIWYSPKHNTFYLLEGSTGRGIYCRKKNKFYSNCIFKTLTIGNARKVISYQNMFITMCNNTIFVGEL